VRFLAGAVARDVAAAVRLDRTVADPLRRGFARGEQPPRGVRSYLGVAVARRLNSIMLRYLIVAWGLSLGLFLLARAHGFVG
jgi:hypothetical protein